MFKAPDLDLSGGSVQDTWNTPHGVQTANDCDERVTDWPPILVNNAVDWPTFWLQASGVASRREYISVNPLSIALHCV